MTFDKARRLKWLRGRAERGLEDDPSFVGDAALEMMEETMDLANYADQLHHEKRISHAESMRIHNLSEEIYNWAEGIALGDLSNFFEVIESR